MSLPRSPSARPWPARIVGLAAVAVSLAACSSSPNLKLLESRLQRLTGLTRTEAHCIATELKHTLTAKELKDVAGADGRGGIKDPQTVNKVDAAVKDCVVVTTTTVAPGPTTTSIVLQEP